MTRNTFIQKAVLWLCLGITSGCAVTPENAAFRPVPQNSEIYVQVLIQGNTSPEFASTGESVAAGALLTAGAGMGAGALAGAGAGAALAPFTLLCGPLVFVCLGTGMVTGAVAGGVVGGVVGGVGGGVIGIAIALPEEKATQLQSLISQYLSNESLQQNLLEGFREQQAGRWVMTDENSDATITLGIEKLEFAQFTDDELSIHLTSSLVVSYGPEEQDSTKRILVNAETDKHHVDYWIENEGINLNEEMKTLFDENSRQIVEILSRPLVQTRALDTLMP